MHIRLKSLVIALSIFFTFPTFAQAQDAKPNTTSISWMSFEDAVALNDKAPKKIFIDVYTAWCGWCKKMDASTLKDTAVVKYISDNYNALK